MRYSKLSLRTKNYLNQVKGVGISKIFGLLTTFLTIPILIRYLGVEKYGVWSTLVSVVGWAVLLDLGIGNSLRNRVGELLAKNKYSWAAYEISEAYRIILIITSVMLITIFPLSFFIKWQNLFNVTSIDELTLRIAIQIVFIGVLINTILMIANSVINAMQRVSVINFGQVIASTIFLIGIYVLSYIKASSIIDVALVYGISMVTPGVFINIWLFKKYPKLISKITLFKRKFSLILDSSSKFLVIQLSTLVLFMMDRILMANFFGPEFVTQYDVIYKVFGIILMFNAMISTPLWSAYTEAFHKNDLIWIMGMLKKQISVFFLMLIIIIIFSLNMNRIVNLWIGDGFVTDNRLVWSVGLFIIIYLWNSIFVLLLNGVNKVNIQFYISIITVFINIPIALFFIKIMKYGLSSIILATCISLAIGGIAVTAEVLTLIRSKRIKLLL